MGVLSVCDLLPGVREVVTVTAVNPNTVLQGYRDLEHEGLVRGRAGHGTFVRSRPLGLFLVKRRQECAEKDCRWTLVPEKSCKLADHPQEPGSSCHPIADLGRPTHARGAGARPLRNTMLGIG